MAEDSDSESEMEGSEDSEEADDEDSEDKEASFTVSLV